MTPHPFGQFQLSLRSARRRHVGPHAAASDDAEEPRSSVRSGPHDERWRNVVGGAARGQVVESLAERDLDANLARTGRLRADVAVRHFISGGVMEDAMML